MKRGKFIVFEGISGTGKETQATLLQAFLVKHGKISSVVYHPTPELKSIFSDWRRERNIDALAEVYLLLADRESRIKQVILPALARGEWIISLRSWVSALVYQGHTDKDRQWIAREFQRFEPKPDRLFYFDIAPRQAIARITKRHKETGEPIGKFETRELLKAKRNMYLKVTECVEHIKLNAALSIDAIHKEICTHCKPLFQS